MQGVIRKIFVSIVLMAVLVTVVSPIEAQAAKRYYPVGKYTKSICGKKYILLIDKKNDKMTLDIYPKGYAGEFFLSARMKKVKGKKNVYRNKYICVYDSKTSYKSKNIIGITITVYKKKLNVIAKNWKKKFGNPGVNIGGTWKRKK